MFSVDILESFSVCASVSRCHKCVTFVILVPVFVRSLFCMCELENWCYFIFRTLVIEIRTLLLRLLLFLLFFSKFICCNFFVIEDNELFVVTSFSIFVCCCGSVFSHFLHFYYYFHNLLLLLFNRALHLWMHSIFLLIQSKFSRLLCSCV